MTYHGLERGEEAGCPEDVVTTKTRRRNSEATALKGQCHEIFYFWFFHESVSPKPLSKPFGPFRFFSKIRGDIHSSRFATGVNDTGGKCNKSSIIKVLII